MHRWSGSSELGLTVPDTVELMAAAEPARVEHLPLERPSTRARNVPDALYQRLRRRTRKERDLEPIIRIEQLTHTYSAGTPFQRSAVDGV